MNVEYIIMWNNSQNLTNIYYKNIFQENYRKLSK
jgi:hypothetical protein